MLRHRLRRLKAQGNSRSTQLKKLKSLDLTIGTQNSRTSQGMNADSLSLFDKKKPDVNKEEDSVEFNFTRGYCGIGFITSSSSFLSFFFHLWAASFFSACVPVVRKLKTQYRDF